MIPFNELKEGVKYFIIRENDYYEGIFVLYTSDISCMLQFVRKKILPNISYYAFGYKTDIYYDANTIIQNAKRARESREKRTINMVLQKIIGDESFEW